eukprot:4517845-Pyramimonas_sp.AAC.1
MAELPKGRHNRKRALDQPAGAGEHAARVLDEPSIVRELVHGWALGHYSAPAVQRLASRQHEDQVSLLRSLGASPDHVHESLRRLSALGDHGRSSHVQEALLNFLGRPLSVRASMFDVQFRKSKTRGDADDPIITTRFPIMLPHVAMSHYYESDRN